VGVPIEQRIDRPIDLGSDEENIREATRQMREREREWEQGVGSDDPFSEQRSPVIEVKYDGRDSSAKTLRQATKDVSDRHLLEKPEAQFAMQTFGMSEADALGIARNKDYLRSLGYSEQEADA
jgi:hypothetical protein